MFHEPRHRSIGNNNRNFMQSLQNFNLLATLNTVLCLVVAFVCGSIIGLERQIRQRTAGLRTNTLVAVGAAVFVDLAMRVSGADGATRVISYVVSGVGFLGAGAIMKEGANITGLNTAATLWGSAAVGACAGAGLLPRPALPPCSCWPATPCCAPWSTTSTATPWPSMPARPPTMST
jgi:putative Mg2+ transporter-C (MgtC) family protein